MGQEVVLELPGHHKDSIEQLLNLWIPCLSVLQDLTNKVHMLMFDFCHGFTQLNGDDCTTNDISSYNI
jgi:hypothetical protein